MIRAGLERIERRLDTHDASRRELLAEVASLKQRMTELNDRAQQIESRLAD
jgi:prefoldin subunit 5